MNKRIVGAVLLLVLGVVVILSVKFIMPWMQDRKDKARSDAKDTKGKITVAVDSWMGYFPLRSPEMMKSMRRAGWLLSVEDDKADYPQRMKRLRVGCCLWKMTKQTTRRE